MSDDSVPTLVFSGPYAEVLFLKTLIESAGIETSLGSLPIRGGMPIEAKLYVRRADAEHANELVDDFRRNGHRTERDPFFNSGD
jgi:hypothetical protein